MVDPVKRFFEGTQAVIAPMFVVVEEPSVAPLIFVTAT